MMARAVDDGPFARADRAAEWGLLRENFSTSPRSWEQASRGLDRRFLPLALVWFAAFNVDVDELAKAVADAWTMPDNPMSQLTRVDWLGYFQRVGFLDNDIRGTRPVTPVHVFRGATLSRRRRGSWTSDIGRARWFADRYPQLDARVWQTVAPPASLLAHFHGAESRNEDEYVVNTAHLRITEADNG